MDWLPEDYRDHIGALMAFPLDTTGSLATFDYFAIGIEISTGLFLGLSMGIVALVRPRSWA